MALGVCSTVIHAHTNPTVEDKMLNPTRRLAQPRSIWKQGTLGLLGGLLAFSLSGCGSSPSSTLTTERTTDVSSSALLSSRPGKLDPETFMVRWQETLERTDFSSTSSLTREDAAILGVSLGSSLVLFFETLPLSETLFTYSIVVLDAIRFGGIDAIEQSTILARTEGLEQEALTVNSRGISVAETLAALTPQDPELEAVVLELQALVDSTVSATDAVQSTIIVPVDGVFADSQVDAPTEIQILRDAGLQAGILAAETSLQAVEYGIVASDLFDICLTLESPLGQLCQLLEGTTLPTPSPFPTPSPISTTLPPGPSR